MGHKMKIYDVLFIEREVEIPDACPKCGAVVRDAETNALHEWNWRDESFSGHLAEGADKPATDAARGDLTAPTFKVAAQENAGDEFKPCAYWCECGEVFASGSMGVVGEQTPPTGENLFAIYNESQE